MAVTACNAHSSGLPYGEMKKIPIHWDDLESAFERNSPDTESFLDITSGHVISLTAGDPEAPSLKAKVAGNIVNYIRVDPASSREQYRWMERFVGSVVDPQLRERLVMAIDGKGAFRRFKDVLLAYPAERERWFTYRADLLHWHMHNWLIERQIEPTSTPPWGEAKPPPDLGDAPPVPIPHGTEAPGEALRRQARETIDSLPAIELPSAIAFLEFLAARGAKALGINGPPARGAATSPVASVKDVDGDLDDDMANELVDVLDDGRDARGDDGLDQDDEEDDHAAARHAAGTHAVPVRGTSGLAAKAR